MGTVTLGLLCAVLALEFGTGVSVESGSCPKAIGAPSIEKMSQGTNRVYLMLSNKFTCDSILTKWEYYRTDPKAIIFVGVWRIPDNSPEHYFELIGKNQLTGNTTGAHVVQVPPNEIIQAKAGDFIGIHYAGRSETGGIGMSIKDNAKNATGTFDNLMFYETFSAGVFDENMIVGVMNFDTNDKKIQNSSIGLKGHLIPLPGQSTCSYPPTILEYASGTIQYYTSLSEDDEAAHCSWKIIMTNFLGPKKIRLHLKDVSFVRRCDTSSELLIHYSYIESGKEVGGYLFDKTQSDSRICSIPSKPKDTTPSNTTALNVEFRSRHGIGNGFTLTYEVEGCPRLTAPVNGYLELSSGKYILKCKQGFKLRNTKKAPQELSCRVNRWDKNLDECIPAGDSSTKTTQTPAAESGVQPSNGASSTKESAKTTQTPVIFSTSNPTSVPMVADSEDDMTAVAVGVSVGAVLVIALIVALAVFFYRRYKKKHNAPKQSTIIAHTLKDNNLYNSKENMDAQNEDSEERRISALYAKPDKTRKYHQEDDEFQRRNLLSSSSDENQDLPGPSASVHYEEISENKSNVQLQINNNKPNDGGHNIALNPYEIIDESEAHRNDNKLDGNQKCVKASHTSPVWDPYEVVDKELQENIPPHPNPRKNEGNTAKHKLTSTEPISSRKRTVPDAPDDVILVDNDLYGETNNT